MPDRNKPQPDAQDQKHTRREEHPERPRPGNEPESPGGRRLAKAGKDALDKSARRGER